MNNFEIISGIFLIVTSVAIIILCLMQGKKDHSMTSAISGAKNESAYGKNSSRTIEAKLSRITKICAILFFVATLATNIIPALISSK